MDVAVFVRAVYLLALAEVMKLLMTLPAQPTNVEGF